jgi:hypothetical protein
LKNFTALTHDDSDRSILPNDLSACLNPSRVPLPSPDHSRVLLVEDNKLQLQSQVACTYRSKKLKALQPVHQVQRHEYTSDLLVPAAGDIHVFMLAERDSIDEDLFNQHCYALTPGGTPDGMSDDDKETAEDKRRKHIERRERERRERERREREQREREQREREQREREQQGNTNASGEGSGRVDLHSNSGGATSSKIVRGIRTYLEYATSQKFSY